MNFKELIFPIVLALIATIGLHFYFRKPEAPKDLSNAPGQIHEVQHDLAAVAPLTWGLTFAQEPQKESSPVTIETDYARMTFSGSCASIEKLEFKHNKELLSSIAASTCQEMAFLIAFEDKTPANFTLVDKQETADAVILKYQSLLADNAGTLVKTFTINKKLPKVDLAINLALTQPAPYIKKLRVFFPAPLISGSKPTDVHAFVNDAMNENALKSYRTIPEITHKTWLKPTLCGINDRFFIHALLNDPQGFVYRCAFSELQEGKELIAQLEGKPVTGSAQWTLSFYFGPKQMSMIKSVDTRLEHLYEYGIWAPFSKAILIVLNFIVSFVGNYGIAILLLALLIKLLLLPITVRGERNMAQQVKKQADLQRKMQHLQIKFRDDPERLRQEKEALIREHGVGGMLGGCLPVLLQIPIFFALQRLLSSSIELYHTPFLWIGDLSSPDRFYVLPILCAISVLLQAKVGSKPIKQQFSTFAMALLMGAVAVGFPSGVALYICSSMFLGVLQSRIFNPTAGA